MYKIMFVCHGNICRSPMAEFVMKELVRRVGLENEIFAFSSATSTEEIGNDVYPPARRELARRGIPFERRAAVQLARSDYAKYDLFVGMDSANVRNMHRIFGSDNDRKIVRLLDFAGEQRDVLDPWYSGNFEKAYIDILHGCKRLLEHINDEKCK